jgi:hypothetical protein
MQYRSSRYIRAMIRTTRLPPDTHETDHEAGPPRPVKDGRRKRKPKPKQKSRSLGKGENGANLCLTTKRKVHDIREILRQCKHVAAHLGELTQRHDEQITRKLGAMARSHWLSRCPECIAGRRSGFDPPAILPTAMLLKENDIGGKALVCMTHIARIARCLSTILDA